MPSSKPSVTILALGFWLFLTASPVSAASEHGTADWARANFARLEGQRVTLQAASCRPGRIVGDEQWFRLHTYSKDGRGGDIEAMILTADAPSLFTKLGSTDDHSWKNRQYRADTKPVIGFLRQLPSGAIYLDLRPTERHAAQSAAAATPTSSVKIRTWTATDGRTVEAEFLSANTVTVRIRRVSDGQVFTLELAKLAPEDRAWVSSQQ